MKQNVLTSCTLILCTLLSNQTIQAQCTLAGTNPAGTNGNNTSTGSVAWVNTGNTTTLDGNYASAPVLVSSIIFPVTTTTQYLTLNNFGFNIPNTYTICGVGLSIARDYAALASLNGSTVDNVVQLATINSPTSLTLLGSNQASGANWPYATIGNATYGGNGNLMGATLTPTSVSATNFGVAISANVISALSILITANIDKVSMSIYTNPPIVLPIKLENFTVSGSNNGNIIDWAASANDIANNFVVQRSGDGTTWQDIATITASTGSQSYSYTDETPLSGPNYYRLELVNTDGTTSYSVIAIIATKSMPQIRFYPNPFHDMINITAPGSFTRLALKDIAGRTLWVKEYSGGGVNTASIPAGDLPQGLYFVSVDGSTYKIIKN